MSKYTTQVRYICEQMAGLKESLAYHSVSDILKVAAPKIFNFQYPIFDESYREELEIKILRHYYTREICAETVGLWKLWLESKMNDIMPYYNQLYKSALLKFPPFEDTDYRTTHHKDNAGNSGYGKSGDNSNTSGYGISKKEDKNGGYGKDYASDEHGGFGKDSQGSFDETTNQTGTADGNSGYGKSGKEDGENNYNKSGNKTDKTTYDSDISTSEENEKTGSSTTHSETDNSGKQIVQGTIHTDGKADGTTKSHHEGSFTNWDLFSDTPQGQLEPIDNMSYLTTATKKYGSDESDDNGESHDTNESDSDSTTTTTTDSNEMTDSNTGTKENGTGSGTKNQNDITNLTEQWDETGSGTDSKTYSENGSEENHENSTQNGTTQNSSIGKETGSQENHINGEESGSHEDHMTASENQSAEYEGQFKETGSNEYNDDEDFWEHVIGKMNSSKSYSQMLLELRETFLNIDLMIIKELEDLFFLLY